MEKDKLKLNLGSGKSYITDAINVDVREDVGADVVCDVRKLEFPKERFKQIFAIDIIAAFNPIDGLSLLKNCYDWLKPNGVLDVHIANLRVLARALSEYDDNEALKWLFGTDGHGTTNYESNYLKWAYSKEKIKEILTNLGFTVITAQETCNGFGVRIMAVKK